MRRAGRTRFNIYVATIIGIGGMIVTAALLRVDVVGFAGDHPASFWLYTACLLLCELKPVKWLRRQDGEFTASWTFACALLLSAPLASALLLLASASVVGDLINRKTPLQTAFNGAQLTISMSLGAGLLVLLGDGHALMHPSEGLWPYILIAACAGVVIYLTNSVLTMIVLALHQEVSVWSMVRHGVSVNLTTDGMLLALAPIFVVVSERSVLLMPLLLLTAWAVYDSATRALARQHEAMHDMLTQLPNRRMFGTQVQRALDEAARRGRQVAIMLVDLDGFKEINDRLGHHVGDLVLQAVSGRFKKAVRPQDLVARLGGDEFAVLLTNVEGKDAAVQRAGDLLASLEAPCTVAEFPVAVSGSFGIALYPDHGEDPQELLQRADKAMYHAKARRLGVSLFTEARDRDSHGRLSLLSELQDAIDAGDLSLVYQPKMRLADGAITGVEALLRWRHPTRGLVPPSAFMPLAEQTELMPKLTEHVLGQALAQCAAWADAGMEVEVAVNGSARNLIDPRFVSVVERLLAHHGVQPELLEIELTENTVMADPYHTGEVLVALRRMGVRISIDDFGTGYSSLTTLRDLPIDRVKLDRSFVTTMSATPREALIVRSIVDLARGLGLQTIAEGVESAEVLEELKRLGCDAAQGYLIARPASGRALTPWLRTRLASRPAVLEVRP